MKNLRNTLVAIASLAVVLVLIALGNPVVVEGQPQARDVLVVNTAGNPVPVSVQNGADERVLITLVQDTIPEEGIEFDPVDLSEFNTISFMASSTAGANPTVLLFFAAEPGSSLDPTIAKAEALVTSTFSFSDGNGTMSIGGPFLIGRVEGLTGAVVVTVKAYLSR